MLLLCYNPLYAKRNTLLMFSYGFKMLSCKKTKTQQDKMSKNAYLVFSLWKNKMRMAVLQKKNARVRDGGESSQPPLNHIEGPEKPLSHCEQSVKAVIIFN